MGITAIKHITNTAAQPVYLRNHENPPNSATVVPNSTGNTNIWIPWCSSQSDWQNNHYLSIEQPDGGRTLCWIWQQDDYVRFCTDGQFHNQGQPIPGVAYINADRSLTINTDSSIILMPDLILPGDYRTLAGQILQVLMGWYDPLCIVVPWVNTGWWNGANAMEAMTDYALLTGSTAYHTVLATIYNAYKGGNFRTDAIDDEGWWALAWIKAYDLTGRGDYLNMAKQLFADMASNWNTINCQGGLPQLKSKQASRLAIPNALYIALAARLYLRTNEYYYLEQGQTCWQWFQNSGMIGTQDDPHHNMVQNLVNDGLAGCSTSSTGCCNNHGPIWTYNQGVLIGGLTDLFQGTHDASQLQMAHTIAHAAITPNPISSLVTPQGILQDPCEATNSCDSDQTQFKGIFMRNLAHLNEADPRPEYRRFILANADSIIFHDRDNANRCGVCWSGPIERITAMPPVNANASLQSSALDALNAALPFAWSASFAGQTVSTTMTAGHTEQVTITMRNTGTVTWSASEATPPVRLGSQNPQDNMIWNIGRVDVPFPVAPGMTVSFTFSIRAPNTDGTYIFQWRMVQETVTWFGDFTPAITISVTGSKGKEKLEKEGKERKDKDRDVFHPTGAPGQSQALPQDQSTAAQGQAFILPTERPVVGEQPFA